MLFLLEDIIYATTKTIFFELITESILLVT